MMRPLLRALLILIPAIPAGAILMAPAPAQAGIEDCGDIYIEAGAECEVVPPGADCDVQCTPLSVRAACAARLYAECDADCTADPVVNCTTDCQGSCQVDCDADPGRFDCRAACQADCDGSCEASCSSDDSQCQASCQATCSASCDAQCEVVPPSAECEAQCEACCDGYCEADANIECQITCQASGYVDCELDVEGGCRAACDLEEGALFCDGQWVDHGGNLEDCIESLEDLLDIRVEGYVRGDCDGNECEVEAGGTFSCGVGATGAGGAAASWTLIGLALLIGAGRRRKAMRGPRP
jgi:hypothetical protein